MHPISVYHLYYAFRLDGRYTPEIWSQLLDGERKRHPLDFSRVILAEKALDIGIWRPVRQVIACWLLFELTTYAPDGRVVINCFKENSSGRWLNDHISVDREELKNFLSQQNLPLPSTLFVEENRESLEELVERLRANKADELTGQFPR